MNRHTIIHGLIAFVTVFFIFLFGTQVGFLFGWNKAMSQHPVPTIRKWDPIPAICVQPPQEMAAQLLVENDTIPEVDVKVVATVTNFSKIETMVKEVEVEKEVFNRHEFFGLAGIGPTGVNVHVEGTSLEVSQDFGPVVGGGYRFNVNKNLGVGGFGLSNSTFGAVVSWEF